MAHYGYRVYAEAHKARAARGNAFRSAQDRVRNPLPGGDRSRRARVDLRALDILGAEAHWTRDEIKKRYRLLVKNLHPDLNGGKCHNEGRFREVVWAWQQIRESHGFAD